MQKFTSKINNLPKGFTDLIFFILVLLTFMASSSFTVYQTHLWLIVVGAWGVYTALFNKYRLELIDKLILILSGLLVLHCIFFVPELLTKHFRFFTLVAFPIFFINAKRVFRVSKKENTQLITIVIIVLCLIQAGIGILQYFEIAPYRSDFYKVVGSFRSPNFLGAFLSFGVISSLWLLLYSNTKNNRLKAFVWVALTGICIALLLTQSRTAGLMVLSGGIFLIVSHKNIKERFFKLQKLKKGILLFCGFLIFSVGINYAYHFKKGSADGRLFIAKTTLNEIAKNPLLGHGFFSFTEGYNTAKANYFLEAKRDWNEMKTANHVYLTYNDYLYFLYEYGFVWCFLCLGVIIYYLIKTYNPTSIYWKLGISYIFTFLIGMFFTSLSDKTFLLSLLFIGLALLSTKKGTVEVQKNNKILSYSFGFIALLISCFAVNDVCNRNAIIELNKSAKDSISEIKIKERQQLISKVYDYGRLQFQYGLSLWKKGNKELALVKMNAGFAKNRLPKCGKIFAEKLIAFGNYKKAEEILKFNSGNEPFRFEPRMQLLKFYKKNYDKSNLFKVAKEIVALPVKIPSEKIEGYKKYSQKVLEVKLRTPFDLEGHITKNCKVKSTFLNRTINYKLYIPNTKYITKKTPVLYLVDGQMYINNKDFVEKVDRLIQQRKIQPIHIVCVDPRDVKNYTINHRNEYFLCNADYVNFFINELVPTIEKNYPVISNRDNRAIMGHSFGGLFASYLGVKAPFLFKNIIMQSPAFHPCPAIYNAYKNSEKLDLKMYLSYGTGKDTQKQDLPMIEILQNKKYDLKVNEVKDGNHDWKLWMGQMEEIMLHFYKN